MNFICRCDGGGHYLGTPGHLCYLDPEPSWRQPIEWCYCHWSDHGSYVPHKRGTWSGCVYPGSRRVNSREAWRREYERTGAQYALARMQEYDVPSRDAASNGPEPLKAEPTAEEKAQQLKDEIYHDLYPSVWQRVNSWEGWRREYERTGAQYALDRMQDYPVPNKLTMFDKDYEWPASPPPQTAVEKRAYVVKLGVLIGCVWVTALLLGLGLVLL